MGRGQRCGSVFHSAQDSLPAKNGQDPEAQAPGFRILWGSAGKASAPHGAEWVTRWYSGGDCSGPQGPEALTHAWCLGRNNCNFRKAGLSRALSGLLLSPHSFWASPGGPSVFGFRTWQLRPSRVLAEAASSLKRYTKTWHSIILPYCIGQHSPRTPRSEGKGIAFNA